MTDRTHAGNVRIGVRIEVFTVIWMAIETIISLGAGIVAASCCSPSASIP